ncbi:MAG: DNA mismatch repair protein MutS [Clostridiales bacterium]|nr:DNA mismatch repair protein MutS [Clostridiales bacterium]
MSKEKSAMMQNYEATKEQYKDCILFYRLGDFYEMFNEDAIICSKELDLTLTGKSCGLDERAPMCGVPHHAYESYVQRLIEKGYKVAICEQTDKIVNKVMQREVVRIITPGTVIDSAMLTGQGNNYIMCIYKNKNTISYAYGDLSTGEINVGTKTDKNIDSFINDQIVRIMPNEVICNEEMFSISADLYCVKTDKIRFNQYYEWAFKLSKAEDNVKKQYGLSSLKGYDFQSEELIIALGAMLEYFYETQKRELKHLKMPKIIRDEQFMYVDTNTRRNLEIETTMRENEKHGSLLWVLDDTQTSGGARMLKSWVRLPLQDKKEINKRLDMVEFLCSNALLREELKLTLAKIQDIERFAGRICYGNISPKDCLALANSLDEVPNLKRILTTTNQESLLELNEKLVNVSGLVDIIRSTIDPEAPANLKDGGYIRQGFNKELDYYRSLNKDSRDFILDLQQREKDETGIKNLKIGYNRIFGYYIEVGKLYLDLVPFRYIRKQTTANAERYITEELKKFEEDIITSTEKALKLEEGIFLALKEQLAENVEIMQQIANIISTIDCIYSLASVAYNNDYCRPKLTNDKTINIKNGRHPVIEKVSKSNTFIPNDCVLNDKDQSTIILTGPNMAGKSTYMRQVALITYMAHIGSFVPATEAEVSIVDRIFTRIGASDDLAVGQSTFMVEMIEVANILNYCTNNSLIILDEVGRGTSTFDGLSIAWAVVEYLATNLNAKTLFATHYHELMQLEGKYEGVKNYCISIKEIGGKLVFLRKIMRGSATRSYGIEVASLAGLPETIISRSKELMQEFESEKIRDNVSTDSEIVDILKHTNINEMSPMSAFETLSHLINLVK